MQNNDSKNSVDRRKLVADRHAHSIQVREQQQRADIWDAYHVQARIILHHWGNASPERKAEATAEMLAITKRRIAQLG